VARTFDVQWQEPDPKTISEGAVEPLEVRVVDRNSREPIEDAMIDFSIAELQIQGHRRFSIVRDVTDADGTGEIDFDADEAVAGDKFDLYASAGDDVDRLRVEIADNLGSDSVFSSAFVSDLVENDDQEQQFAFELGQSLSEGDTIEIDVEETGQNIRYPQESNDYSIISGTGSIGTIDQGGNSADTFEYEAGPDDTVGDQIEIEVGILEYGTGNPQGDYDVMFTHEPTGETIEVSFNVS